MRGHRLGFAALAHVIVGASQRGPVSFLRMVPNQNWLAHWNLVYDRMRSLKALLRLTLPCLGPLLALVELGFQSFASVHVSPRKCKFGLCSHCRARMRLLAVRCRPHSTICCQLPTPNAP